MKLNKTSGVPSGAAEEETDKSKLECGVLNAEEAPCMRAQARQNLKIISRRS